jgi:hypothetical protein
MPEINVFNEKFHSDLNVKLKCVLYNNETCYKTVQSVHL